jgi:hypothetical protein
MILNYVSNIVPTFGSTIRKPSAGGVPVVNEYDFA